MVNAPSKGIYYGGAVAGPVFKEIADKVYANSHNLHGDIKLVLNQTNPNPTVIKGAHKQQLQTALNLLGKETKRSDSIEENGSEWAQATILNNKARIIPRNINKNMMPDVLGMGLKDAIYLLENNGLQVQAEGYGKVKLQSIPAGTLLTKGTKVIIKLG
jgi:cell division protein FtsI (penicillin-binding protein 3)